MSKCECVMSKHVQMSRYINNTAEQLKQFTTQSICGILFKKKRIFIL